MQNQEALLLQMLKKNAETEYGKTWQFAKVEGREDYRSKHPLTTYENYRPYIERLAKGEQNLLTKDLVDRFSVSSGTTGKCKLLPSSTTAYSALIWKFFFPYFYILGKFNKEMFIAPLKVAAFSLVPRWRYSECGLPIGPASGCPTNQRRVMISIGRTLPNEAEVYMSEPSQLYLHWLLALYDRDLVRIDGLFAGGLLFALELLETNWKQLVADVRQGTVTVQSHTNDFPDHLINELQRIHAIWPDAQRADELETIFARGFEGIIPLLWPRISIISVCVTGAHAIYIPRLRWYFGPDINFYSPFYGASEGIFGMNTSPPSNNDEEQHYTLLPHLTFMEFIAEEDIAQPQPKTLFMDELEVGRRYEIVITSIVGFYRYRMGDLIQVVGYRYGVTPVVRFCSRVGSILDLRGEKTAEDMIFNALLRWSATAFSGHSRLVDFTTTESITFAKVFGDDANYGQQRGLNYVIFVEISPFPGRQLTHAEISLFDNELCEISYPYKSFRLRNSIGMPKMYAVKEGTFQKMKEFTLAKNGAISNQYKPPRYLACEEKLRLLMSLVVKTPDHFEANGKN